MCVLQSFKEDNSGDVPSCSRVCGCCPAPDTDWCECNTKKNPQAHFWQLIKHASYDAKFHCSFRKPCLTSHQVLKAKWSSSTWLTGIYRFKLITKRFPWKVLGYTSQHKLFPDTMVRCKFEKFSDIGNCFLLQANEDYLTFHNQFTLVLESGQQNTVNLANGTRNTIAIIQGSKLGFEKVKTPGQPWSKAGKILL